MKNFRDLRVWQKSHELALATYGATRSFPKDESYGLISQMRRGAVSIAANIAEGCGRRTDRDFARFLQIAIGSASELEYHLLIARDLGYLPERRYGVLSSQVVEVKRMLTTLIQKLKADS